MTLIKRLIMGWLVFSGLVALSALVVRRRVPEFGTPDDDQFSVVAAMTGRDFTSRAKSLTMGSATAFAGGVELDLTEATIRDGALLKLKATFGGIDVIVPDSWRVEVTSRSVMGGIGNLTDPDGGSAGSPLLIVDAQVIMGGVEIHSAGPV